MSLFSPSLFYVAHVQFEPKTELVSFLLCDKPIGYWMLKTEVLKNEETDRISS